jgi:membrane protein DedA with SNARE-associated domain
VKDEVSARPRVESVPPRVGIGWKDVLCVGPIIANSIYYWVGVPLQAILIGSHPLLLSALRGSIPALVTTGAFARVGRLALYLALIAPVPILMITDPFYFWAGRRYGKGLLHYLERNDPRWHRRVARGERFFKRFGVWAVVMAPVLPVPSLLFYMAAGEAGMPLFVFLLADLAGTLLYIGAIVAAGWLVGQPAVTAAQAISNYALWVIIGFVVLTVAWSVWSSSRNTQRPGPPLPRA